MRLIKKLGEDAVYIWTEALAKRGDMTEVIKDTPQPEPVIKKIRVSKKK